MTPNLFWIPNAVADRLAISARPRGGDWLPDEIAGWKRAGITLVASLLEPDEERELELVNEATECATRGVRYLSVPVPDRGVPTLSDFTDAVIVAVGEIGTGGRLAVHCRQGIGRSGLFAVAVLKTLGVDTDNAIRAASAVRGRPVPETPEQTEWLRRFAAPALAGTK